MISIIVITHNRLETLRLCVEKVLSRTSAATQEIVVWNNGSTDGTQEYLENLDDDRIRVVNHDVNLGCSAYRPAAARTHGEHLITVDHDVIDAPAHWDSRLLNAFMRLPHIGFLSTDLQENDDDEVSVARHKVRAALYEPCSENGVPLLTGPVGGWCAITSRDIYERAGGFREDREHKYWLWDAAYIEDIGKFGYSAALLADVRVLHRGRGSNPPPESKVALQRRLYRQVLWKNRTKRILLAFPGVRGMNERRRWFEPPDDSWETHLRHLVSQK